MPFSASLKSPAGTECRPRECSHHIHGCCSRIHPCTCVLPHLHLGTYLGTYLGSTSAINATYMGHAANGCGVYLLMYVYTCMEHCRTHDATAGSLLLGTYLSVRDLRGATRPLDCYSISRIHVRAVWPACVPRSCSKIYTAGSTSRQVSGVWRSVPDYHPCSATLSGCSQAGGPPVSATSLCYNSMKSRLPKRVAVAVR